MYDESIKQISDKLQEMQGKVNSLFDENVFKNFDELNTNTLRYYQSIKDKFISTYQETFGQITAKLNETQATIGQFQTLLHKAFQHIPDIQDDFLKSSIIKLENLHGEFLTRLNRTC